MTKSATTHHRQFCQVVLKYIDPDSDWYWRFQAMRAFSPPRAGVGVLKDLWGTFFDGWDLRSVLQGANKLVRGAVARFPDEPLLEGLPAHLKQAAVDTDAERRDDDDGGNTSGEEGQKDKDMDDRSRAGRGTGGKGAAAGRTGAGESGRGKGTGTGAGGRGSGTGVGGRRKGTGRGGRGKGAGRGGISKTVRGGQGCGRGGRGDGGGRKGAGPSRGEGTSREKQVDHQGDGTQRALHDTMSVIDLTGHAGSLTWESVPATNGEDLKVKTRFVIEDEWPALPEAMAEEPGRSTSTQGAPYLQAAISHVACIRSISRGLFPNPCPELLRRTIGCELEMMNAPNTAANIEAVLAILEEVCSTRAHGHGPL